MELRTLNSISNARIERPEERPSNGLHGVKAHDPKSSFQEALLQAKEHLSFSKHAEERLKSLDKPFDNEGLTKLEKAVDLAHTKGARSTLVLMKGVAFLVAPESRTVITVIPQERMKENVFTSIDSAILADR